MRVNFVMFLVSYTRGLQNKEGNEAWKIDRRSFKEELDRQRDVRWIRSIARGKLSRSR